MQGRLNSMWRTHIRRPFFAIIGVLFFAIGLIGAFLPLLPTTPFMLLALWAFSRSSERLHNYVWHHPRFGRAVRDWALYRVVPRRAKLGAVLVMSSSAMLLIFLSSIPWWGISSACAIMLVVAIWLCSRPEQANAARDG